MEFFTNRFILQTKRYSSVAGISGPAENELVPIYPVLENGAISQDSLWLKESDYLKSLWLTLKLDHL